jgi:hypothetical protein
MDRLNRVLNGGTLVVVLGILVAAPGCHTSEKVPPGKQYPTSGGTPSGSLNFNSDPHPNNGVAGMPYTNSMVPGAPAMPGMPGMQGQGAPLAPTGPDGSAAGMGAPQPQFGTPAPNAAFSGVTPTAGAYGGPVGTATPSPYGSAGSGR